MFFVSISFSCFAIFIWINFFFTPPKTPKSQVRYLHGAYRCLHKHVEILKNYKLSTRNSSLPFRVLYFRGGLCLHFILRAFKPVLLKFLASPELCSFVLVALPPPFRRTINQSLKQRSFCAESKATTSQRMARECTGHRCLYTGLHRVEKYPCLK